MITVRIVNPQVKELKGVSKTTGKDYHIRTQVGHAFVIDRDGVVSEYPEKFEISLERDQPPFAAGFYQLHPSAVYVNRDGRLAVAPRLMATPAPETRKA
jgi:hypothetical protein